MVACDIVEWLVIVGLVTRRGKIDAEQISSRLATRKKQYMQGIEHIKNRPTLSRSRVHDRTWMDASLLGSHEKTHVTNDKCVRSHAPPPSRGLQPLI